MHQGGGLSPQAGSQIDLVPAEVVALGAPAAARSQLQTHTQTI